MRPDDAHFWATQAGAELDLLFFSRGRAFGVECKYSDIPKLTKSMITAMTDLELIRLWVVYPGKRHYLLAPGIEAWPITDLIALPGTVKSVARG
ncbi:MAG: hypothetical protein HQM09_23160 [Candidatus Riflebacteria bacterium]|nr:hypothetical protein [Candidatus Riflebacteria bacterium]